MDTQNLRRQEEEARVTSCRSAASSFLESENRNRLEKEGWYLRVHSQWAWQRPTAESQSTPGLCCWLSPANRTPRSINTFAEPHYNATMAKVQVRKDIGLYHRSIADYEGPQCPGEAQTQQHIEYIATDGVGHGHVPHSWNHWYGGTQIFYKLRLNWCH